MKTTHVTVANAEFYDILREDSEAGETNWTVNRRVKRGDKVLLYVCAPVSAVVATGDVSTDAIIDDEPSSAWFGHYFVDLHNLKLLGEPLSRERLIAEFPEWGYWRQPRSCVAVPPKYIPSLERLLYEHK